MRTPWLKYLDLRKDQADPASIEASVMQGVGAAGTNLWVLIFAIMIASIGLNVNSTAVIIGAMLISPLMGPIVGIGYGAGVSDFALIRQAAKNLGVMAAISLATATIYFSLTPLGEAHSELLARTTPTLWDVLIAFFGGAAGIVALTRKEISNAVPGVAIATALMPPLCTAGYGLANLNLEYFAGAFYLFAINSVFIALATLLFVKLMKLPIRHSVDAEKERRHAWIISVIVVLMIVPSSILAYRLVREERFNAEASKLIAQVSQSESYAVIAHDISAKERRIVVTATGDTAPDRLRDELLSGFASAGFDDAKVAVRVAGAAKIDMSSLRTELARDLYLNTTTALEETSARVKELEDRNRRLEDIERVRKAVLSELTAQFPSATSISVTSGERQSQAAAAPVQVLSLQIVTSEIIDPEEEERLKAGWRARFPDWSIDLVLVAGE